VKASAAQLGAALDRGGGDVRLFVLHGPDEATAGDYALRLGKALGAGAERIDVEGSTLKSQPGRLADEAAALGLFGGARWIRTTAGEEASEAAQLVLDMPAKGAPVVLIAPSVKASGKLVKLALASPQAMAFACYMPEGRDATQLAFQMARDEGVRLVGRAADALVDIAGGERGVLRREIEKLALYLDAAPDRLRDADDMVVATIAADLEEQNQFLAVDAVLLGALDDLVDLAERAEIPLLRALERRLLTLAAMRSEVDEGQTPATVVERHRVFWKERDATARLLKRWSSPAISDAVRRVRLAGRTAMSRHDAGEVIAARELVTLARLPARP
jgi:DNA polymerase-3 subunit delta